MNRKITGILGTKLGMTQVFDENNRVVPVTVVQAGPNVVTQVRTPENDGYVAVQLAYGAIDPRKVNKPRTGHFAKAGATPRRHLVELRTSDAGEYTVGQEITAEVFEAGAVVDVVGTSKGKGTAGVMKRHGFKGLGASHGTQRKHRSPGLHRRLRHPGPGVQGPAHGRPDGHGPGDHPEPHRAPGGHRARAAADQGRGARPARAACCWSRRPRRVV